MRGRWAMLTLVLCGVLLAVPSFAAARGAYVTGSDEGGPYAVPIDLAAQTPGAEVPLSTGEGAPSDVAITPDGSTAYVPSDALTPIDVATNAAEPSIPVSGAYGVAISPDGSRAYVTDQFSDSVNVIDVAANTVVGSPIPVGSFPRWIAVTPNGAFVYVVNAFADSVSVIETATNTVIAGPIAVGNNPSGIAITPSGSFAYVVNSGLSDDVSVISTATNAVVTTIPAAGGNSIAITPDGSRAITVDTLGNATPIDLATNTAGATIPTGDFLSDLAILPDGSAAYAVTNGNLNRGLVPIDLATDTAGSVFDVGNNPEAIAIVPNQGPRAAFSASHPEYPPSYDPSRSPITSYDFDARDSTDSDGTIARYDWDFGDGTTALNPGATPSHTFPGPGTYIVTLTVTDNEGCSLEIVFTGQTAYCNGSELARTTRTVTIEPSQPPCPKIVGRGKTFKPKIVPGHVVPGVRVRLAANQPVSITVRGTLIWSQKGSTHRTRLGTVSGKLNHWRRIRFPLPPSLRDALPIGSRVRVQLRIAVTPRRMRNVCGGRTITKTLSVRVKSVFPNRVQRGRTP